MSEPKLVSPLLDGYIMGAPISHHDGVCCCPAMQENSDNKYIVKIISIPASQKQLDALLLTGAYSDTAAAANYFKDLSDDVVREAELLSKLSKLEGYLPYEGWQIVPMENNQVGYDVYLLGSYKNSLDRFMRKNLMTHLNAVNLGLDMCAALAIARKSGYMYVDLTPANIFISDDKEYRIGDLGFVDLNSLKFASMPSKYLNRYTAPEVLDPMSTLNDTVDIYAAGLILYQVYNNGALPFEKHATAEVFPAPVNADYEIAEIILKACAPNPADRWQDPIEMGQALVDYMQRNVVNDEPIAPPIAQIEENVSAEATEQASEPETHEELAFMKEMVSDETAPDEADAVAFAGHAATREVSSMLAHADTIIAHRAPAPAVAPPAPPLPVVTPEDHSFDEDDDSLDPPAFLTQNSLSTEPGFESEYDDEYDDYDDEYDEQSAYSAPVSKPRKKKGWIAVVCIALVLALVAVGGFYYYRNYYQQSIDGLDVTVYENQLTVTLDTQIEDSALTIICSDSYGNAQKMPVSSGKAVFTELKPDTLYMIKVEISGFHELTGFTSASATTEKQTIISDFTAVTGLEDGTAILQFQVEGPEAQDWSVIYSTDGEDDQSVTFTGYTVTISNLTVDKTYTFTLVPSSDLYMVGKNTLEFTASKIIMAEDLKITAFNNNSLTAQWSAPADTTVESWTIRCYNEEGYDETLTTTETSITFTDLDTTKGYTVEVTASGMTRPVRTSITADPITITEIRVDESSRNKLTVTWAYEGNDPVGGWLLMYTIDNGKNPIVVQCESNTAEISPLVPGATYHLEIQPVQTSTIFGGQYSFTAKEAETFDAYECKVVNWTFNLCKTPNRDNWSYQSIPTSAYTTTFKLGESISILIHSTKHYIPRDQITILYVIRDAEGNVISELTDDQDLNWYQMWVNTYPNTALTVPKIPTESGEYTLYLYFNGFAVGNVTFTVTE